MLNVTVVGTVRDDSGHLQSGSYWVEYKGRRVTSSSTTDNSQVNFNVGDHDHLGCNGTMRYGDVMYVVFENESGTKKARRVHTHQGENVVKLDIVSKADWGLNVNLESEDLGGGMFRFKSNGTGDTNVFRVYVCGESVFDVDSVVTDWKLVKTIESEEDVIEVAFSKSVKVKVEVEAVTEGHVSELGSVELDVVVRSKVFMIEWE